MEERATRYPLAWPPSWKRTLPTQRRRARFKSRHAKVTVAAAIDRLAGELDRLGASTEILSTNVQLGLRGLPLSNQRMPDDPGVAVYFQLKKQPKCLACDRWDRVADNIAAIAQHIDALRRIDRYGVGTMEQAFAGYTALPPSPDSWWLVFELPRESATMEQVEEIFKRKAREHHPDLGGSHNDMARLTEAREAARRELASA